MSAFDPIPSIALDLQERFAINDGDSVARWQTIADVIKRGLNNYTLTLTTSAAPASSGDPAAALRAIVKMMDGSQSKDYAGALMVARSALGALVNQFHEYACGCKVPTAEMGRYYDHYCASCYREGWERPAAAVSQHGIICRICTGGKACEHCKGVNSMQVEGGADGPRCADCNQLLEDKFHTGVFFHTSPCTK